MNRFRQFLAAGVFAALAGSIAAPALAQQPGTVSGVVTDPLGARVPNATVTLTGGPQSRDAKSGNDGAFSFTNVAPGLYQVVATLSGFQPYSSDQTYVGDGATRVVNVTLQVSPLEQKVVVTAAATGVSQAQTGAPVTVIDSTALDVLNKPDVLEALRLVPGTQVVQTGAPGGTTSLFIRGGNSNFNKVLIDGAVANDIGGGFDFAQLSTAGVERVEVMRQTNSVMYGSDALAGVVSVETKRGRTRVPEFTYAADGGNFGTWSSDAGIGGVYRRFNYYSGYRRFETDNDVPNNDYSNGTYAGRFGVALGSKLDLSGTIRRTDAETGSPNGYSMFRIADDSRSTNDLTYATIAANSQINNRWQTTVRFGSTDQTSRYINPTPTGIAFDPFNSGFPNYLGQTVTLTGANGYSVTGQAILDFGGTYPSTFDSRSTRRGWSGQTTYVVSNAFSVSGGGRWEREHGYDDPKGDPTATRNNGGAFVEGRATLMNRHYIAAGLGIEHNEAFGEAVTPRLSIASYLRQPSVSSTGDTKLVMNLGTGIKAPALYYSQNSLYELVQGTPQASGVEPIGPERSRNFDIGIEQGLARNRARVRASYFHNRFNDLIEFLDKNSLVRFGVPPAAANATAFGAAVNSQSYRAQGLELAFEEAPRHDLHVAASYTYVDAEVTAAFGTTTTFNPAFPSIPITSSAIVGERPFRRPTNSGTVSVIYTPKRYEVALSMYFSGKRDDSTFLLDGFFGDTMLLPNKDLDKAYQKVDLSGAFSVIPRLKAYTSIENLFNQDYEGTFGFPSLPLRARVGFKLTVGGDK